MDDDTLDADPVGDDTSLHRRLRPGQDCVVHVLDTGTGDVTEVHRSGDLLLEAPNWLDDDTLVLNGEGRLWCLSLADGSCAPLDVRGLPELNNDHVLSPGRDAMYVSGYDWHLHHLALPSGPVRRITEDDPAQPLLRFLHGVSPDDAEVAFVGMELDAPAPHLSANIFTVGTSGGTVRRLTAGDRPSDGPEYSPDGRWIHFNTEMFGEVEGHAQIARMRPDGSELTQLTFDDHVNWFPHLSPDGRLACYLSYAPGTVGHPADQWVEIRLVDPDSWDAPRTVATLFGGQGTLNVNSWAADSRRFAFVSYPEGAER